MKRNIKGPMLLMTLIGAAAGIVLSEIIMDIGSDLPSVLLMAAYYTIPMLLAMLGAILSQLLWPVYHIERDRAFTMSIAFALIIATVGGILASAGMQFLYQMSWQQGNTNVVLLMDHSSSMVENINIYNNTFKAADTLVNSLKNGSNAAIVYFNEQATVDKPMSKMDAQTKAEYVKSLQDKAADPSFASGTTEFKEGVNTAISAITDINSKNAIFMITDGEGAINEEEKNSIIGSLKNKNVALYALDLEPGDEPDAVFTSICSASGGNYIPNEDPEHINNMLMELYNTYLDKNSLLLNRPRQTTLPKNVFYYIAIRSLFYILLGVIMSLAYMLLINRRDTFMLYNIIGGILGAIIVEVCNYINDAYYVAVLVTVLFICPALVLYEKNTAKEGGSVSTALPKDPASDTYVSNRIIK